MLGLPLLLGLALSPGGNFADEGVLGDLLAESGWEPLLRADTAILDTPATRLVVNNPANNRPSYNKEVSETDMYLLNAIEKLAYRVEALEKRLRRTEELIIHIMEGSNIKRQDGCPGNFTRVARNCYYFGEKEYNWKSANSMCKSLGTPLLEIESKEEFMEVVGYIQATNSLRGLQFWTGGLNPGLLWLWAGSGRPVDGKVDGQGRCLSLATDTARLYRYRGEDCGKRTRYICEHPENPTLRAINRIHKALLTGYTNHTGT